MTVVVAGAGIAGLTLGLTLDQLRIPFRIVESVRELRPLGVGINLQPHAVRELFDLGLQPELDRIGVRTGQYGFYTRFGLEIWVEPRGTLAGYRWPQYSVHRGRLQMVLQDALIERAGEACLRLGDPVVGYELTADGAVLCLASGDRVVGDVAVGADGIHSAVRAQMHPDEGPPVWAGAILWRGTSLAPEFFGGATMALAGNDQQRIVAYPIRKPNPESGLAEVNWIAERRVDPAGGWRREDWNRRAEVEEFLPYFTDWVFDWLDVPALVRSAEAIFEYPMVDRDPVDRWTDGRVTLIGDAAQTDTRHSHEDGVNMGLAWGFERATEKELEYAEEVKDTDWIHWPLTEDQWPTLYRELVHLGFESYVRSNGDLVLPPDEFIHGFLEGAAGAWRSMADDLA